MGQIRIEEGRLGSAPFHLRAGAFILGEQLGDVILQRLLFCINHLVLKVDILSDRDHHSGLITIDG